MDKELEKALEEAHAIKYEAAHGNAEGIDFCPECNKETFAKDGVTETIPYGKCLYCGFTMSEDEAWDEETARAAGVSSLYPW